MCIIICIISCMITCITYINLRSNLYHQSCPPTQHAQAFMIAAKMKSMLLPSAFCIALVCQSLFSRDMHVHDLPSNCMHNDVARGPVWHAWACDAELWSVSVIVHCIWLGVACAEIIKDHKALTYSLKPKDLEEAAENACKLKTSEINTIFPDVSLPSSCSIYFSCFVWKQRRCVACIACLTCAIICMSCTSRSVALS